MSDELKFLDGGGVASQMIRDRDWTGHPLGAPQTWPPELKSALSLILNSPESMILSWGSELSFFFNETYFPLLGPRLPWAMGERFDKVWADGWDQAKPIIDTAFLGKPERFVDLPWKLGEDRGARDTWWTFSYSRVLDRNGDVAGLFIFTNETTEKYLGDIALRESEQRYRELSASLEAEVARRGRERDRLWTTTNDLMGTATLGGYLTAVNPAWTNLLGWADVHLLKTPFIEIVDPEDHGETADVVCRLSEGETVTGFVNHVRTREGHYRTIMWTAVPEPDSDLFYIVGRDLTEQFAVEDQLRQAQKMEAVGQLTGGIAHDFNNLLAGISGSLELIETRMRQGRYTETDKYISAAKGAAMRAAALTHRLLAFSRRQTLDPRPTDINHLIRGIEELIARTTGPSITLQIEEAADLWTALVDPPQLENAILNLCINARDAMPDSGRILIETANVMVGDELGRREELIKGEYLTVKVIDNGVGMSPDVLTRVFEPFYTTKPLGEGTGLGLSMVYGFAKQSGGKVRIHSEVGRGTEVCIYLPRFTLDHGQLDLPEEISSVPVAGGGETVLLVDDEPLVRMLMADVLEENGYVIIEASDGVAGLKVLQSDARIDILITDVGLPGGLNGRQMADAARVHRPGLKVLFITGYAENAVLNGGNMETGMAILTKPFPVESLAGKIRDMLTSV